MICVRLDRFLDFRYVLQAQPDQVSPADWNNAQQVFLNFQKTKSPFDLCRELLERSTNQFVLFQVGCCLKNGVICEWANLNLEQARSLFTYLFEYVNCKPSLEQFVIQELMLVNGIIFKRILLDDSQKEIDKQLIASLTDIIRNPNAKVQVRLNACSSILEILNHFCSNNTDYGITWYKNTIARRFFEKLRLKEIFKVTVEILFEHMKLNEAIRRNPDWIKLTTKLIQICERILGWNTNTRTYFTMNWVEFVLQFNLVTFFVEIYLTIHPLEDAVLLHYSLSCLDLLGSMNLPSYTAIQRSNCARFIKSFIENIIKLFTMVFDVLTIKETVFISNLINSISTHLRFSIRNFDDFQPLRTYLDMLSKFTIKLLLQSTQIPSDDDNLSEFNQAINYLLNSWVVLINFIPFLIELNKVNQEDGAKNCIKIEEFENWTKPIFETYIRAHLSQPEGYLTEASYTDSGEVEEFEEDDNTVYRDQLMAIGTISQFATKNVIDIMTKLFLLKLNQFEACIANNDCSEANQKKWIRVSEDIHWILMISRHIFSSFGDSEGCNIIKLSIDFSANIQQTVSALQSMDCSSEAIDPVVRFFIVFLKFVNMEKCLMERQWTHWISPQVSCTLTQFINAFMFIYLIPPESDTAEMSLSLNTCFGADSPTSKQLVNFFLDHLLAKFVAMSSESALLDISIEGMKRYCKEKDRKKALQESSSLALLLEKFSRWEFPNVNANTRQCMYYVFMVVYCDNLDKVIDPLIARYQKFCSELQTSNKQVVHENFMQIMECTQGIINALNQNTCTILWDKYLVHLYNDLPKVLSILHGYSSVVQMILELMFNFSFSCSAFLNGDTTIRFYTTAVNILSEYARHNTSVVHADQARLEELQKEFIWILKFLNDLSSSHDIAQLFGIHDDQSLMDTISKVVLTSLNILMQLMNEHLLEDAQLCELFYSLLRNIAQDFNQFRGFPPKLSESFLRCVEYVFTVNT